MPEIVTTRAEVRATLGSATPGFVPTMGALHEGHFSLMRRAVAENSRTVVSIFVNPKQFANAADLVRYPRDVARDIEAIARIGVDLIFAPGVDEIYPVDFETTVEVSALSRRWEGEARPGHFRGVTTVVTLLLNLVSPERTYFGEKDFQQLRIVQRLHADLNLPGQIVPCPTVRDGDGLALSSRNVRLPADARQQAAAIPRALQAMVSCVSAGEREAVRVIEAGREELVRSDLHAIDYLAIVDPTTLEPVATIVPAARALVAVEVAGVRLIDNVQIN